MCGELVAEPSVFAMPTGQIAPAGADPIDIDNELSDVLAEVSATKF